MQYRIAPDQDTQLSPTIIPFKRPISGVQMAKI